MQTLKRSGSTSGSPGCDDSFPQTSHQAKAPALPSKHGDSVLKYTSLPANVLDASDQIELWQASAVSDTEPQDAGIAARLCRAALDSLSALFKPPTATSLSRREKTVLRRCHAVLKLWADGHGVWTGELDQILERTMHLQHTTLSVLHSLCRTLLAGMSLFTCKFSILKTP
jgi:hypothetical protein